MHLTFFQINSWFFPYLFIFFLFSTQVKLKPAAVALLVASFAGFSVAISFHAAILVHKKCKERRTMSESDESERSIGISIVSDQQPQMIIP